MSTVTWPSHQTLTGQAASPTGGHTPKNYTLLRRFTGEGPAGTLQEDTTGGISSGILQALHTGKGYRGKASGERYWLGLQHLKASGERAPLGYDNTSRKRYMTTLQQRQ